MATSQKSLVSRGHSHTYPQLNNPLGVLHAKFQVSMFFLRQSKHFLFHLQQQRNNYESFQWLRFKAIQLHVIYDSSGTSVRVASTCHLTASSRFFLRGKLCLKTLFHYACINSCIGTHQNLLCSREKLSWQRVGNNRNEIRIT